MDMKLKSYNAIKAQKHGKPLTFIDRLILLRSFPYTHNELEFSERHGNISFSATLRDGAKCCRFKQIPYKYALRWDTLTIPCSDTEEDAAWAEACRMADLPLKWHIDPFTDKIIIDDSPVYGGNAIKYDVWGQICHITKWNIWPPNPKKTWCSKACARVIIAGKGVAAVEEIYKVRAEMMPSPLTKLVKMYFG